MCDEAIWSPVLPHLEAMVGGPVQVHIADHGETDSLGEMAERLLAHAPDRFALAGHSMGARVALEVMRRAPERVERLALLDTGYLPLPHGHAGEAERAKRHALLEIAEREGTRAMGREWAVGMVHPDRLHDAVLMAAIVDMVARKPAEVFAAQVRALLARPDGTPLLQALALPTTIACGRQDAWSPLSQHEEMQRLAPGSTLAVIEAAGHMAPMERPAATARVLAGWLGIAEG